MWRYIGLFCLAIYILGGVNTTPFHADEADHLFKAKDYISYFVLGKPASLQVNPPVAIDSEEHIRLLTGTVNAYLTGFILWQSGKANLQSWYPAWYYPQTPAENRSAGRVPPRDVLGYARLASALLSVGTMVLIYKIASRLWSSWTGILSATLFSLHPVILLNGRRGMQESALMFFTLACLYVILMPANRQGTILLGILGGLALASKPTALISLMALSGAVLLERPAWRNRLLIAGMIASFTFLMLTPAIWGNPPARLWLAAEMRAETLAGQRNASPLRYDSKWAQMGALIAQPFPSVIQYYESPAFDNDAPLIEEIRAYQRSPWHGVRLPAALGMSLAGLGVLANLRSRMKRTFLIWCALIGLSLALAVPLAWQRYYLLWTLCVILLSARGLTWLGKDLILQRFERG